MKTLAAGVVAGLLEIRRANDVLEPVYEADLEGLPVVRHRSVDTFGIMMRAGTITREMYDTARDFQVQFTNARFDAIRCMPLMRLAGGDGPGDFTNAQLDARRGVGKTPDEPGRLGSPAGSCTWHDVGRQRSIRERAVVELGIAPPPWGQVRVSNELRQRGLAISPAGVRCVWQRHELTSMKHRLKALEAKRAQDGIVLTEAQIAALEKAKADKGEGGPWPTAA
jgi:hypothetical protein